MELPFYYNLEDFKDSYLFLFQDWKKVPENENKDLLHFLNDYYDFYQSEISQIIKNTDLYELEKIENLLKPSDKEFKNFLFDITREEENLGLNDSIKYEKYDFVYDYLKEKNKDETKADKKTVSLLKLVLVVEDIKNFIDIEYLRFTLSQNNILNDEREIREFSENNYSGKGELKPKEKLILLDKLGIVDLLIYKLSEGQNATHLAEIIGAITGIDNTKGTLTGYCNYLLRPDNDNKNSPYNSEATRKKAMQIYNTFKLDANK